MKLKELKTGVIFNIESTASYPKLKIDGGYVDLRDDIINKSGNCDDKEVEEMFFDDSMNEWVEEKKKKYL